MAEKAVLVLVDGMRPDGMLGCGHPFVEKLISMSSHALDARTCFPSVTLPCHMSLFHSVDPDRHGILTNTYVPQVRPIDGLFDVLGRAGKKCGFFYTWEELRDLCRPNALHTSMCCNLHRVEKSDERIAAAAVEYIRAEEPDFLFLYLGETDEVGHAHGWMGEEYLAAIHNALSCIERVYRALPEGYQMIVLADHGGHGRSHGTDMPEDMTIPLCFVGSRFEAGAKLTGVSIKDVAPTVASLLEVAPAPEWEGTPRA